VHQEHKNTITQHKLKHLKSPGLVAFMTSGLETEQPYCQKWKGK